jgi:hypothetical protein
MRRPWPYQIAATTVNVTQPAPRNEADTVAVGLVPDRADRLMSLHVGPSHVLLSCEEAKELAVQLTRMDRRQWHNPCHQPLRRKADRCFE